MVNQVTIIGRIVGDAKVRKIEKGVVLSYSLAVNVNEEKCMFFPVVTFAKEDTQLKKYLTKGRKIAIVGMLDESKYTAKDGTTKSFICIVTSYIDFLDSTPAKEVVEDDNPF